MAGDRWGVSATWSIWVAAVYGGLIGPPLQVVQNAVCGDQAGVVLSEKPEYLLGGLIVGSAVFMLVALVRNRLIRKADQLIR